MRRRAGYKNTTSVNSSLYNGLIAQYSLNESIGQTTIIDKQGYSNGTLISGTLEVSGKLGTAYRVNGSEVIDLNTKTLLGGRSAFTFSCWYKNNSSSSGNVFGSFGATRSSDFRQATFNSWNAVLYNSTGTLYDLSFDAPSGFNWVSQGIWRFLIITYDGTTLRCFVNNQESINSHAVTGPIRIGSVNERIGAARVSTSKDIDEVVFWNRALTPEEKTSLWNNGNGIEL